MRRNIGGRFRTITRRVSQSKQTYGWDRLNAARGVDGFWGGYDFEKKDKRRQSVQRLTYTFLLRRPVTVFLCTLTGRVVGFLFDDGRRPGGTYRARSSILVVFAKNFVACHRYVSSTVPLTSPSSRV